MAPASGLRPRLRARWVRFDGPARLAGLDLARGLAVVGMLAAHLLTIDDFELDDPATWVDVVNGRSSILFATLAGVSIALVSGARTPVTGAARARASGRLALRAAALFVVGMLLMATGVPVYVILPAYAILFVLALPFLGMRPRALFALAGALALVMPFVQAWLDASPFWLTPAGEQLSLVLGWAYPFPVWIAFVLAGLGIGRCDLRAPSTAAWLTAAGTALALLGYGLDASTGADPLVEDSLWAAVWTAGAHSSGILEVVGSGGFAIAVIGVCLLLCRTAARWVVIPLRAVGAMPLTAYCAQLIVWAIVAAIVLGDVGELGGFRDLQPFWPMTLGLVLACTLWILLVGRGPLEAGIDRAVRGVVHDPDAAASVDRLER